MRKFEPLVSVNEKIFMLSMQVLTEITVEGQAPVRTQNVTNQESLTNLMPLR